MSDAAPAPGGEAISVPRLAIYTLASLTFGLAQGLGNNLVAANLQAAQGTFGATTSEAACRMPSVPRVSANDGTCV